MRTISSHRRSRWSFVPQLRGLRTQVRLRPAIASINIILTGDVELHSASTVSQNNEQSDAQTHLAARGRDLRRRERRRWSCARCRFGVQHAWTNRATCQWRVATRFAAVQLIEATSHCTPARAESLSATARRAQRHTRRPSLKTSPAKSVSGSRCLCRCVLPLICRARVTMGRMHAPGKGICTCASF